MRETVHSHIYRGISKSDKRPVAIKVAREATREAHAAAQQELEIVRSELTSQGAIHSTLCQFRLG